MEISVKAISSGRWSVSPKVEGTQLKGMDKISGYEGPWPRGITTFLREYLRKEGYPVPENVAMFFSGEHGAPHDWLQFNFPSRLRPGETTSARRAGLTEIANLLVVA
jgi:hypothetical protein